MQPEVTAAVPRLRPLRFLEQRNSSATYVLGTRDKPGIHPRRQRVQQGGVSSRARPAEMRLLSSLQC